MHGDCFRAQVLLDLGRCSHMEQTEPSIYIVILNWNGWEDTIECLESVFRNVYPNYRVIVCDNNSHDGSFEHIKAWAEGRLDAYVHKNNPLRPLSFPPVQKPVNYAFYESNRIESAESADHRIPLILIQTGENSGYAGGCNVGIRYALSRKDCQYIWLLNNDTVVDRGSLTELHQAFNIKKNMGICGSCLRYYHDTAKIQAFGGGYYNRWLGTTVNETRCVNVRSSNYFVIGASMFTSRDFLTSVGLLCENYFIYYEEVDWMLRSTSKYHFDYAINSIVYHKEGSSIKAGNRSVDSKSILSDYFSIRNRLLTIYTYDKYRIIFAIFILIAILFNRIRRRQYGRIWLVIKIFFTFNRNLTYHFEVLTKNGCKL